MENKFTEEIGNVNRITNEISKMSGGGYVLELAVLFSFSICAWMNNDRARTHDQMVDLLLSSILKIILTHAWKLELVYT